MAAAVVPAGMMPVAVLSLTVLLLLEHVLAWGPSPLVSSRAGFLVGGVVAVIGMVVLAGAGGVAARLLLAPGWRVRFLWVA